MTEQAKKEVHLSPRSRAKREQIIDASQRLFLRDGFARTSMDAIREEAQVSKPTLYAHFSSKENLFIGVIEHSLEDISDVWDTIAKSTLTVDSKAQLREILLQFARAGLDHLLSPRTVRLARALLAEGSNFADLGRQFRERVPQRASAMITTMLTHAYEKGLLSMSREQIPAASRVLQSQLISYLLLDGLLIFDQPPITPSNQDLETMIDLYIEMIC
jgi:TetR/AcrR family transcriptional repressor of mexJK operon